MVKEGNSRSLVIAACRVSLAYDDTVMTSGTYAYVLLDLSRGNSLRHRLPYYV